MSTQSTHPDTRLGNGSSTRPKIRLGIIGCGEVTQIIHRPTLCQLSDQYEVTALCDVSPVVLEQVGRLWNIENLAADHRKLISRKDVDAVLVANPNAFHAEATIDAVNAGKHVLVEKPMCITQREAAEIIAAEKMHNVVVQVGYMRRYAPAFLEACAAAKRIDEIKFARVRDFLGKNSLIIDRTSRVVRDQHLPKAMKDEAKRREKALLEEALGRKATGILTKAYNLMLGLSSHDISAMRELFGMPNKVLFAACRGSGPYLTAEFDYGDYVCHFETGIDQIPRFDAHLEIYGDRQVVRVQYDTPYVRNLPVRLFITEENGRGGVLYKNSHTAWGDPFVEQWKAFYQNVTMKKVPKTSPDDFAHDLELFAEMIRLMREY